MKNSLRKFHGIFSSSNKFLRRHWSLITGGIAAAGVVAGLHNASGVRDELAGLRQEVRELRMHLEQQQPVRRVPRNDGRIMFAAA